MPRRNDGATIRSICFPRIERAYALCALRASAKVSLLGRGPPPPFFIILFRSYRREPASKSRSSLPVVAAVIPLLASSRRVAYDLLRALQLQPPFLSNARQREPRCVRRRGSVSLS